MKDKSLRELASILNPGDNIPQEETPLLIAVGAVGKALGINISFPTKSDNLTDIQTIADACGFRIRRVTLTANWWNNDCGALLAFTKEKQPVAILPGKSNKYEILDPINLTRKLVNRNSVANLSPLAYTFYRPLPDKEITFGDILKLSLHNRTNDLFKIICTGAIAIVFGMVVPLITGILIDYAIPDANRNLLIQMGLGLFAASFGVAIFQLAQTFILLRLQTQTSHDIQTAVWDRLLKLKPDFFRQYSIGDLHNRVYAITEIRERLNGSILRTLFASLFSLLNLLLLAFYSFYLALIAFTIGLIIILITTISSLIVRRKLRPLQQLSGEIFGLTVQLIGGVSKLRVAAAESEAFACWTKKYTQQTKLMLSSQLVEDIVTAFNAIVPIFSSILLFGLTIAITQQFQEQDFSTGAFIAFNSAFAIFILSATKLSNTIVEILDITILWERAQPILKAKPEVGKNKYHPGKLSGKLSGKLKLEQISFRYRENSPLILDNITIEAQAGEFIAIVGPSGSGKSTIIRLLLGFETPESGTVFYDNQDLSELNITAVRKQLGVVLQNGRIMSGSIWENIAGGAIVTQDKAREALEMAGLSEDIKAMPMGIHTLVSEGGGNLSGGQRQRLFIARALVHQPQILLFDEATSALDNRTQAIVTQSLEQLGVTRLVIAHRLSTIRHADRIYVMQSGKIVQQGSFDELSAVEGLFSDLTARQMA